MTTAQAQTVPESVFSAEFQQHPAYALILGRVNDSPYLVDMLTEVANRGNQVYLEANSRAASYKTGTGNIHIGSDLFPSLDADGQPDDSYIQQFVSLLGHEAGHATDPNTTDRANWPGSPEAARQWGLSTEGAALRSEYTVAQQIGGRMWSGQEIQTTLDQTAAQLGKTNDLLGRRFADVGWDAFDAQAETAGAAYYAGMRPSTAPNITYSEYYPERWAVRHTQNGTDLDQHIDWLQVQTPDIEIIDNEDGSFRLVGQGVPMVAGPHAGGRVDFSAGFDAHARPLGDTLIEATPLPGTELRGHHQPPPADAYPSEPDAPERQPEQAPMPALSDRHMHWLRHAYDELRPELHAQGLNSEQCLQVAAACLAAAAQHHNTWGDPRQFLFNPESGRLGVQHDNLRLHTFPLDQALSTPTQASLSEAHESFQARSMVDQSSQHKLMATEVGRHR